MEKVSLSTLRWGGHEESGWEPALCMPSQVLRTKVKSHFVLKSFCPKSKPFGLSWRQAKVLLFLPNRFPHIYCLIWRLEEDSEIHHSNPPSREASCPRASSLNNWQPPSGRSFRVLLQQWTKVTLFVVSRWPMRLSKVVVLESGHFCQCRTSLKDSLDAEAPPGLAETSWGLQCCLRSSRAPSCLSHFLYRYYSLKNLLYSLSTVVFQGAQPAIVLWIRGQQIMVHGPILTCGPAFVNKILLTQKQTYCLLLSMGAFVL